MSGIFLCLKVKRKEAAMSEQQLQEQLKVLYSIRNHLTCLTVVVVGIVAVFVLGGCVAWLGS